MPGIGHRIRGLRAIGIAAALTAVLGSTARGQQRGGGDGPRRGEWPVVTTGWVNQTPIELPAASADRGRDRPNAPVSADLDPAGPNQDGPGAPPAANGCDADGGTCTSTVPEPETMGLLAAGLIGIALAGLRQRRARD